LSRHHASEAQREIESCAQARGFLVVAYQGFAVSVAITEHDAAVHPLGHREDQVHLIIDGLGLMPLGGLDKEGSWQIAEAAAILLEEATRRNDSIFCIVSGFPQAALRPLMDCA